MFIIICWSYILMSILQTVLLYQGCRATQTHGMMPEIQYVLWPVSVQKWHTWLEFVTSSLFLVSASSSLYCISAWLFVFLIFFFPGFELFVRKQACEQLFFVVLTGSCSPAGRSWIEGSPYSLQMVKSSSSVLWAHNTSISLCVYPAHFSIFSYCTSCLFQPSFSFLLLHFPCFFHLPVFSSLSLSAPFLPLIFFSSYSRPSLFYRLPLSLCSPPASHSLHPPLLWSFLPSLHLPIISVPSSFSRCLLSLSPPITTSPPFSPSPAPSETQPAWHIVFTQPVTGCLCLLPIQRWGSRDRDNQPFGGFSSQLSRCCLSLNLKTLPWKIDCFRGFFLLSSFSIYSVSSEGSCPLCQTKSTWPVVTGSGMGWIVKTDHLRLWTEDTFLLYLIWMKSQIKL